MLKDTPPEELKIYNIIYKVKSQEHMKLFIAALLFTALLFANLLLDYLIISVIILVIVLFLICVLYYDYACLMKGFVLYTNELIDGKKPSDPSGKTDAIYSYMASGISRYERNG